MNITTFVLVGSIPNFVPVIKYPVKTILYTFFFTLVVSSCVAPVNLGFENAGTLGQGAVEIKPSYSRYYDDMYMEDGSFVNTGHIGASLGVGVLDSYDIKLRYEYCPLYIADILDLGTETGYGAFHFIEFDNKVAVYGDKISLSIPLQAYINIDHYGLNPRVYFTFFTGSRHFDLTVSPRCHMLGYYDRNEDIGVMSFYPGISLGCGIHNAGKSISIRPELGYVYISGYTSISFGIAASFRLSLKKSGI